MPNINKNLLEKTLQKILIPNSSQNIVEAGFVSYIHQTEEGEIKIIIDLPEALLRSSQSLKNIIIRSLKQEHAIQSNINVLITTHKKQASSKNTPLVMPQVKNIIGVASGKGGVGKSMLSVNLSAALSLQGLSVGILDADIYGPSLPLLMNITERPVVQEGKLVPIYKYNMPMMSVGFIYEQGPLMWRGPLAQTALKQLFKDVLWPSLDVLVVDLPPGTGDIQLTFAQAIPVKAALVVSTAHKISLIDAEKAIGMFQQIEVPILGIVENMAQYTCTACGSSNRIIPPQGLEDLLQKEKMIKLASIPFSRAIVESMEQGIPLSFLEKTQEDTQIFSSLATYVKQQLM